MTGQKICSGPVFIRLINGIALKKGILSKEIFKEARVGRTTVWRWRNGLANPQRSVVDRILQKVG